MDEGIVIQTYSHSGYQMARAAGEPMKGRV